VEIQYTKRTQIQLIIYFQGVS